MTVFDAMSTYVKTKAVVASRKNWNFKFPSKQRNAEKFLVVKTQIEDIVSNKADIYKAWIKNGNDERKLMK